jgi:hypothetical protein
VVQFTNLLIYSSLNLILFACALQLSCAHGQATR